MPVRLYEILKFSTSSDNQGEKTQKAISPSASSLTLARVQEEQFM